MSIHGTNLQYPHKLTTVENESPEALCPDEALLHLFSFLDLSDLCAVNQVKRRWHSISADASLWQAFAKAKKLQTSDERLTPREAALSYARDYNNYILEIIAPKNDPNLKHIRQEVEEIENPFAAKAKIDTLCQDSENLRKLSNNLYEISHYDEKEIKILIDAGAKLVGIMHTAIQNLSPELVRLIIERQADSSFFDTSLRSRSFATLGLATANFNRPLSQNNFQAAFEIFRIVLQYKTPLPQDLRIAIGSNIFEVVQLILDKGIILSPEDGSFTEFLTLTLDWTVKQLDRKTASPAVFEEYLKIVELLIEKGAVPNVNSFIAAGASADEFEMLRKKGVQFTQTDLFSAVCAGRKASRHIVQAIIDAGVSPKNSHHNLLQAALANNAPIEIFAILIKAGAPATPGIVNEAYQIGASLGVIELLERTI